MAPNVPKKPLGEHALARRRLMRLTSMLVDKLTRCIELVETGQQFSTQLTLLTAKEAAVLKKSEFGFDWQKERRMKDRQVYKLTTVQQPHVIQGLISLEVRPREGFVYMHLVETAKFNRGPERRYEGVMGNLVAFACKLSFENKLEGFINFEAKNALIEHYKNKLRATQIGGSRRMYIETNAAYWLVSTYYEDFIPQ